MGIENVIGFVWQHRAIYDAFDLPDPCKVIDEVWKVYEDVTRLHGSGKLIIRDYNQFMESKWAEVYRRVYGVDVQVSKYLVNGEA